MNRFADVFRPFLEGNVARELLEAPIHHIDAKREKRQITVCLLYTSDVYKRQSMH